MAKTTFEEEIYLRVLTGRLVGKALADLGANKVAVVVPKNFICDAMGSATLSAFLAHSGNPGRIFVVEGEEDAQRIIDYKPRLIVLQFGGETPAEETKRLFGKIVDRLAEAGVDADVVIHVRTYAMGALDAITRKDFLENRNVFVYTVDFDKGAVYINKLENGELVPLREYHVTLEHADLLNRSLKDRAVCFQ